MAFDKRTGVRRWVSECKDPAGHTAGLVPMTVEGVPCVVVLTLKHLLVVRLDEGNEGQTVAKFPWATDYANSIATPAVHKNYVLITSGYNHKSICKLRITLEGANKVWEKPFFSKICTLVIYDNYVYWAWLKVRCLDFETGDLKWEGGSFGDAGSCVVTADGRLIVWGGRGKLALVETAERAPDTYQVLSQKKKVFQTDIWSHVAFSNGRIYCKDRNGNVKCFRLRIREGD